MVRWLLIAETLSWGTACGEVVAHKREQSHLPCTACGDVVAHKREQTHPPGALDVVMWLLTRESMQSHLHGVLQICYGVKLYNAGFSEKFCTVATLDFCHFSSTYTTRNNIMLSIARY